MTSARHDALSRPGQLARAGGVHAPPAGAVLARHLPHPRVHTELAERPCDQRRGRLEALVDAGLRVRIGHGVGELERPLVEDRGAPAGQPQDRPEATRPRRRQRLRVAGRQGVALGERHHGGRPRQPQRLRQRPLRHAVHDRAGDRGVERRVVREAVVEHAQRAHALEVSIRARTWPLRSSARASTAARRSSSSGRSPPRRAR